MLFIFLCIFRSRSFHALSSISRSIELGTYHIKRPPVNPITRSTCNTLQDSQRYSTTTLTGIYTSLSSFHMGLKMVKFLPGTKRYYCNTSRVLKTQPQNVQIVLRLELRSLSAHTPMTLSFLHRNLCLETTATQLIK